MRRPKNGFSRATNLRALQNVLTALSASPAIKTEHTPVRKTVLRKKILNQTTVRKNLPVNVLMTGRKNLSVKMRVLKNEAQGHLQVAMMNAQVALQTIARVARNVTTTVQAHVAARNDRRAAAVTVHRTARKAAVLQAAAKPVLAAVLLQAHELRPK